MGPPYQSEWATDVVFGKPEDLRRLYPLFVHHAMTTFGRPDVLRFLGKSSLPVNGEVTSDLKRRKKECGIKHRYNRNSVKLHYKAYTSPGRVLRAELTMEDPKEFKVYIAARKETPTVRWLGIGCAKA